MKKQQRAATPRRKTRTANNRRRRLARQAGGSGGAPTTTTTTTTTIVSRLDKSATVVKSNADVVSTLHVTFSLPSHALMVPPRSIHYVKGPMERPSISRQSGSWSLTDLFSGGTKAQVAGVLRLKQDAPAGSQGHAVLGLPHPGGIQRVDVTQAVPVYFAIESAVAWTPNVKIESRVRVKPPLGADGSLDMSRATCVDGGAGTLWLQAFGAVEEHALLEGETMFVDAGSVLALPSDSTFTTVVVSKGMSDGVALELSVGKGQKVTTLWTQSNNFADFVSVLSSRMSSR
jgi:uncharacterized protein (AIM24 family)